MFSQPNDSDWALEPLLIRIVFLNKSSSSKESNEIFASTNHFFSFFTLGQPQFIFGE
jgi:hypothetical protein